MRFHSQIQYLYQPNYNLFSMYYIIYPSFLLPNTPAWFIPPTETFQNVQLKTGEQNSIYLQQAISHTILLKNCEESAKQILFDHDNKKNGLCVSKEKKTSKDEDYHPETYVSKKSKKSQQLQNRNVVPNIIRLILSFIQKKGKSSKIVQKLIGKLPTQQEWSVKRFYLYQTMKRSKMNNYVNEDTLKQLVRRHPEEGELYSEEEQSFYNKVTRIIIDYFLREEISVCILTSKRMDRTKKTHHLNALRNIRLTLPTLLTP